MLVCPEGNTHRLHNEVVNNMKAGAGQWTRFEKIVHFTKPHLHNTFTNVSGNVPNAVQQSNYCGACTVA